MTIQALCSISDCEKQARSRGWCEMHYTRWKRHRDPLHVERIYGDTWTRFWDKVDAPGDCWEWTAAADPLGYGRFNVNKQPRPAHRVAWELLVGPVPSHLELDHLCFNPPCVNPDHLEPVTHAENMRRVRRLK